MPSEALGRGLREEAAIPITERCKVGFESQSPIISRCGACHAFRNAGFGGLAGDEVAGAKHFKIALDLGVQPRAVNDRVSGTVRLHFVDRKRITDDVLG